jgi:nicotinate-nucleotide adenylyltransferase
MRTGILGGTFDPPHSGHIALAHAAIEQLKLDEVLLLPAHRNPLKVGQVTAPAPDRLAMVTLAVQKHPQLAVCDVEMTRGGPSYMVESLAELHIVRPGDYWLLVGADTLLTFTKWKQPARILRMCRLAAARRGVHTREELPAWLPEEFRSSLDIIDMPPVEISSSEIRERIALRQPVRQWLEPEVFAYIETHRLYRS